MLALALAVMVLAPACTNDSLDDGDGADVVLEIVDLQNSPVTAQEGEDGTCTGDPLVTCASDADCAVAGGPCVGQTCSLEVVDWTGTAMNVPKNDLAVTSPFNDIVLESVTIQYDWIDGVAATPTRTVGLGGVTVPADGSNGFSFAPIAFQDLSVAVQNQTANLTLTFNARTVENEVIRLQETRQLFVEPCE